MQRLIRVASLNKPQASTTTSRYPWYPLTTAAVYLFFLLSVQAKTFEAELGGAGQWGASKRTVELAKLGLEDCRSGQASAKAVVPKERPGIFV